MWGKSFAPFSFIKRDSYNKKVAMGQRMTLLAKTIELLSRHYFSEMFCSREDPKLGLVLNLCKNRQGRSVFVAEDPRVSFIPNFPSCEKEKRRHSFTVGRAIAVHEPPPFREA